MVLQEKNSLKKLLDMLANIIHLLLLSILGVLVFRAVVLDGSVADMSITEICSCATINEIFTFIGAVAFILFGVVGIYDFAYLNGLGFLVPPAFKKFKEVNYMKQAERMMEIYYKRDINFIQEYEKERTEFMMQAMGIEEKQFNYINYEIVKARTMPARNIYALKCKAEKTILHKEFVINQSVLEASRRVYDKVDYFLNLYTAVYDAEMCKSIAEIMSRYLILSLKERATEIDYIVIPKGSNFLLGLEVGKILHKSVISILDEERIFKEVFWDGVYDKTKVNNIVLVHDILVTGKRIYESIERLPKGTYNLMGIFSLFKYKHEEFRPEEDFKKHGIEKEKLHCLSEISEDRLKKIYEDLD